MKKRYATHITTPDGRRVYVSAESKKALNQKVIEKRMEMNAGVDIADNTTFREFSLLWARAYKKDRVHENTYINIERWINKYLNPYFGDMLVRDIKPMHIQSFMGSISRLKKDTQKKPLTIMKAIMLVACDNGLIAKSPVTSNIKPSGDPAKEKIALTKEQTMDLIYDVEPDDEMYTFCMIALSVGMRKGEILALQWSDIDFDAKIIRVHRNYVYCKGKITIEERTKTAAGMRDIPMPELLEKILWSRMQTSYSDFVVGRDDSYMPYCSIEKKFRKLKDSMGVNITAHTLRHTCITRWFESGMDLKQIQYFAGHANINITLQIYTHFQQARIAQSRDKIDSSISFLDDNSAQISATPCNFSQPNR